MISWQEIAVRLLFAFVLGSATAINRKWYQTKQFIQSSTLMALGATMFSLLISFTSETRFSADLADLIVGISIICVGVSFQKPADIESTSRNRVMRLWFAGAVGSMVGFGFFVPAYLGILIAIMTNLLFSIPEKRFTPEVEQEFKHNLESDIKLAKLEQEDKAVTPQENFYRCKIECWAVDEAEVLALLIQLSNEQKLTPTKIGSRNLVDDNFHPKIEIQIDFISNSITTTLQLQQVILSLKSKLKIVSASWIDLSPELISKNNEAAFISE